MNEINLVTAAMPLLPAYTGNPFVHRGIHLLRAFQSNDCTTVKGLAREYLRVADSHRHCTNYGNAIHQANTVLGLIALEEDQVDEAVAFLDASAHTPGSAQLTSMGPNMLLAQKLLECGRKRAVLSFLKRCKKFWKLHFGKLWMWQLSIRRGLRPNFGANLTYLLDPKTFG